MRSQILLCGVLICSCSNASAVVERVFTASVNVVVNQSSAQLEIVASQHDFLAVYSNSLRRFRPLDIPFRVRQIDGSPHHYELALAQLTGTCAMPGGTAGVLTPTALLDGQPFISPIQGVANPEQFHTLTLTFPEIMPAAAIQTCDGAVGIVATVVI